METHRAKYGWQSRSQIITARAIRGQVKWACTSSCETSWYAETGAFQADRRM